MLSRCRWSEIGVLRSARSHSKQLRRQLGLEGLERRALLDGEPIIVGPIFDFDDETGVLTVTSTSNDDAVTASVVGDENPVADPIRLELKVEVVVGGNTFTWTGPLKAVTHINFNLLEGNDTLRVERAVPQPITVDAGDGDDSAHAGGGPAAMSGGYGSDTLIGGPDADRLDGGHGNDVLDGDGGNDALQGGWGNDKMDGGDGDDRMIGDPGDLRAIDPIPVPGGEDDKVEGEVIPEDSEQPWFESDDVMSGGSGNDRMHGMMGSDRISGDGGSDGIAGGSFDDTIFGGDEPNATNLGGFGDAGDKIRGGLGDDRIDAGWGDDYAAGGEGNDRIQGGWGHDELNGDGGNDVIIGDPGEFGSIDPILLPDGTEMVVEGIRVDMLAIAIVFPGNDAINGGDGSDRIHGMLGNDKIDGGGDADGIAGGHGQDAIDGGYGDDKIRGGASNDVIDAGLGNDYVAGGEGDDEIQGGWGDDNLSGDGGSDLIVGDPGDWRVVDPVPVPHGDDTYLVKVIYLPSPDTSNIVPPLPIPLTGNDHISGGDDGDRIHGMLGNDVIDAGAGDDGVAGGTGHDAINGGDGSDKIRGGRGDDRIDAGLGDDAASGGEDNDFIQGGWGNDDLYGDGGRDVIVGDPADISPPEPIPAPFENADVLVAVTEPIDVVPIPIRRGDDHIWGGDDADRIHGMFGNDVIDAGRGHDGVNGGSGDDAIDGNHGHDKLLGGLGNDRINGGFGNDYIAGGAGDDNLQGGWGNDRISGGIGDDTILGDPGDLVSIDDIPLPVPTATDNRESLPVEGEIITDPERPIRLRGNDLIYGDDGNDRIHGMLGNDRIRGGAGKDGIAGGTGHDAIAGGEDGDRIAGGRGRDRLLGGGGDDNLVGGPQSDYIEGAAGADGIFAVDGFPDLLCTDNSDDVHAEDIDRFVCRMNNPAVEAITLRNSRGMWNDAFLARPGDDEMAETAGGEINLEPDDPVTTIPWGGLDQISVAFDRDVLVGQGDLSIAGGNPNTIAAFHYDPADFVATWTFARPIAGDRLRIVLSDRIRPRAASTIGAGDTLGPFSATFSVLPGDANQDGRTDLSDVRTVASRMLGAQTGEPDYIDEHDADGNGVVDMLDLLSIRDALASPGPIGVTPAPAADAVLATQSPATRPLTSAVDRVMATLRAPRRANPNLPAATRTAGEAPPTSLNNPLRAVRATRPLLPPLDTTAS